MSSDFKPVFEITREVETRYVEDETTSERPQVRKQTLAFRVAKLLKTPEQAALSIDDELCGRIYAQLTRQGYKWQRLNDDTVRIWKPIFPLPPVVRNACGLLLLCVLQWLSIMPTPAAQILLMGYILLSS